MKTVIIKEENKDKILMLNENKINDLTLEFLKCINKSNFTKARKIFEEMADTLETYRHCC